MQINTTQENLNNQFISRINDIYIQCKGTITKQIDAKHFEVKIDKPITINNNTFYNKVICKGYQLTTFNTPLKVNDKVLISFTDFEENNEAVNLTKDIKHKSENGIILLKIEEMDEYNNKNVRIRSRDGENIILNSGKKYFIANKQLNLYYIINSLKTNTEGAKTEFNNMFTTGLTANIVQVNPMTGTGSCNFTNSATINTSIQTYLTNIINGLEQIIDLLTPDENS